MGLRSLMYKITIALFCFSYQLHAAEQHPIPDLLQADFNALQESDKASILILYNDPALTKIEFSGLPKGINANYNTKLIKLLAKKSDSIKEITLTHIMGKLTFSGFIPILSNYQNLVSLNISGNNIRDNMLETHINKLKDLKKLLSLSMASNKIGDKGFKLVFETFNLPEMHLENLYLEKNEISQKNSIDFLLKDETKVKIKRLDLHKQTNRGNIDDNAYVDTISNLQNKFPNFFCRLQEKGSEIFESTSILPVHLLKVVNLVDPSEFAEINNILDTKALDLKNSPEKITLPKGKWEGTTARRVMAIDPCGNGGDATGYAVIVVNTNQEYLVNTAGGIKGNGLNKQIFLDLIKIAEDQKVQDIVIESNYHNGAYLELFKTHYESLAKEKIWESKRNPKNYPDEITLPFSLHNYKTTDKDKGTRIIATLDPLLKTGNLYIEEKFFHQNFNNRNEHPSLYIEMGLIKPNFKSQSKEGGDHDDVVDALELAISYDRDFISKKAAKLDLTK